MTKRICVIYTGGTIGMAKTSRGYAPRKGFLKQNMDLMPEFAAKGMPEFVLHEYDPLLDSSNVTIHEWNQIAADIERYYDEFDGFVVLHGTDTMAYTASALSFMLHGLTKPVIVTGSQIPLCELRNDGKDNLITSFLIAANYPVPEVCVYFGNTLLRGNRTTKVSADALVAFDSPNYPPLAQANVHITLLEKNIRTPEPGPFRVVLLEEAPIAVLKVFPGIQGAVFENLVTKNLKGLVIEAFGTGNIPQGEGGLHKILEKADANGTAVVVCTQCRKGGVRLGAYAVSDDLLSAGAISACDMMLEAAVTKLYYLLSLGASLPRIKEQMQVDLRGELSRDTVPPEGAYTD